MSLHTSPNGGMVWHFPLPRPYTGIVAGNGTLGIMVWGGETLRVSIARNGFWDHRGGIPFASKTNFAKVRQMLEGGKMEDLRAAFADAPPGGVPIPYRTPTQLPGGRLELRFSSAPSVGRIDPATGILTVTLADGSEVRFRVHPENEYFWIGGSAVPESIDLIPAWRWIGETLAGGGCLPPKTWDRPDGTGFEQKLPDDSSLRIEYRIFDDGIVVATSLGTSDFETPWNSPAEIRCRTEAWWKKYHDAVPKISIPDPALQRAWDYGIWKQACMTPGEGVPATLQGPFMAETDIPPWSNDFHFNINLQMIYWPALPTNRPGHLLPVWRMLHHWLPKLKENAALFFGNPDALMLPHAVDDRCQVIGNFWQGTIDQACTAWMAQIAWQHYRHTMDRSILEKTAWPLLVGAFEGFWAMTEENGGRFSLPVSVSAEFPGWGRNASFQLAAFRMTAALLEKAAGILDKPADPRWERILENLPHCCTMDVAKVWGSDTLLPRIVLWEGQDLTESHRHHSHLAGVYPFCTIDPEAPEFRELVKRSMDHWATMGPGQWTGWSMPWAAILWARCNEASGAVSVLRIWEDIFTNCGGGTLHNADSPGYSAWIHGPFLDPEEAERNWDQMQMDAGFGAVQALVEIFVQQRGEVLHVLPSLPKQWRDFSFEGILCEGAFLVDATVRAHSLREVRVRSLRGAPLDIALPSVLACDGNISKRFARQTRPGEVLVFTTPDAV